jgi:DNA replication protein DnaD
MSDGDDMVDVRDKLARLRTLDPVRYEQLSRWIDEYLNEVEVLPESMRAAKKSS